MGLSQKGKTSKMKTLKRSKWAKTSGNVWRPPLQTLFYFIGFSRVAEKGVTAFCFPQNTHRVPRFCVCVVLPRNLNRKWAEGTFANSGRNPFSFFSLQKSCFVICSSFSFMPRVRFNLELISIEKIFQKFSHFVPIWMVPLSPFDWYLEGQSLVPDVNATTIET